MERFKIENQKLDNIVESLNAKGYSDTRIMAVLDGDWPNADEHQEWLSSAGSWEIADWAEGVLVNEGEPDNDKLTLGIYTQGEKGEIVYSEGETHGT